MTIYSLDGLEVKTPGPGRYWVAPNAAVMGRVELGVDASIWFNVIARGDNDVIRVMDRSNVQDGCVLHTDPGFPLTVEPDCSIGHMAMLHGCTVGRGSLIGIGAVVLNGAVIGEECLIGAKSLVGEGRVIPPRSLVVGVPGKVVRSLTDDDVARIRKGVASYQEKWKLFAARLDPQPG